MVDESESFTTSREDGSAIEVKLHGDSPLWAGKLEAASSPAIQQHERASELTHLITYRMTISLSVTSARAVPCSGHNGIRSRGDSWVSSAACSGRTLVRADGPLVQTGHR